MPPMLKTRGKRFKDRGSPGNGEKRKAGGVLAREVSSVLSKRLKLGGRGSKINVRRLEGVEREDVSVVEDNVANIGVVSDSDVSADAADAVVGATRKVRDGPTTVETPIRRRPQRLREGESERERESEREKHLRVQGVPKDSDAPHDSDESGVLEEVRGGPKAVTILDQSERERKSEDALSDCVAKLAELVKAGVGRARMAQTFRELATLADTGVEQSGDGEVAEAMEPVAPVARTAVRSRKLRGEYVKQYADRFAAVCQTPLTDSMTAPDMAAWLVAAKHAVRYAESCCALPDGTPFADSYTLVSKRIVGRVCKYAISVSEAGKHKDTAEYLDALVQGLIARNCKNVTSRADAMGRLAACRQGEREALLDYLDRYRAIVEFVLASAYNLWGSHERERWRDDVVLELQQGLQSPSLGQRLGRIKPWEEKSEDFDSYWQYICQYLIDYERRGSSTGSVRVMAAPDGVTAPLGVAAVHPVPAPHAPVVHESRVHQIAQGTAMPLAVAPHHPMTGVQCYRCGQLGHIIAVCPMNGGQAPMRGMPRACYGCGKPGHILKDCRSSRGRGQQRDGQGRRKYKREETRGSTHKSPNPTSGAPSNARVNAVQGVANGVDTVDGVLSSLYNASASGVALSGGARICMIRGSSGAGGAGGGGKRSRGDTPKGTPTPRRINKKAKASVAPPTVPAGADKAEKAAKKPATEVAMPAVQPAAAAALGVALASPRTYAAAVAKSVAAPAAVSPARARAPVAGHTSPSQGKGAARLGGARHRSVAVKSWESSADAGVEWMDRLGECLFEQLRSLSSLLSAFMIVIGKAQGRNDSIEVWWRAAESRLKEVLSSPEGLFGTVQQREEALEEGERGLADMLGAPLEGYGNTLRSVGAVMLSRTAIELPESELVEFLTPKGQISVGTEKRLVSMCLRAFELYWLLSARAVVLRHLIRDMFALERKLPGQIRVESRAALYRVVSSASPVAYLEGFAKALPKVLARLTPCGKTMCTLLRIESWSGKAMFGRNPSVFGFSEVEADSHEQLLVRKDNQQRARCPRGLSGETVKLSGKEVDDTPLTQEEVSDRDRALSLYSRASMLVLATGRIAPPPVPMGSSSSSSSGAPVAAVAVEAPKTVDTVKTGEGVAEPAAAAAAMVERPPTEEEGLTADNAGQIVSGAADMLSEAVQQVGLCVQKGTARGRGVELRMSLTDMWASLLDALDLYGSLVAERDKVVQAHAQARASGRGPTGTLRFGAGLAVRKRMRKQVTQWLEAGEALCNALAETVKNLREVYRGEIEVNPDEVLEHPAGAEVGKEVLSMWQDVLGGAAPRASDVVPMEVVPTPPRNISEEILAVPVTPPLEGRVSGKAAEEPTPALERVEKNDEPPTDVVPVLVKPDVVPQSQGTTADPPVAVTSNASPSRYEGGCVGEMGDKLVGSACRRHESLGCCMSPSREGGCCLCCTLGLITPGSSMSSGRPLTGRAARALVLVGADMLVDGSDAVGTPADGISVSQGRYLRAQGWPGGADRSRSPDEPCCVCVWEMSVCSAHVLALRAVAAKKAILCVRALRWGYDTLDALSVSGDVREVLVLRVTPGWAVVLIPKGINYDTVKQRIIKLSTRHTRGKPDASPHDAGELFARPDERLDRERVVPPLRGINTIGGMALYKCERGEVKQCAERLRGPSALQNCVERGGGQRRYISTALMRVATSEADDIICRVDECGCVVMAVAAERANCNDEAPMRCHGRCLCRVLIASVERHEEVDEVGFRPDGQELGAGVDCPELPDGIQKAVPNTPLREEARLRTAALEARVAQMRVADRRIPEGSEVIHPLLVALLGQGGVGGGVAGMAAGNPASPYVTVRFEEREDLQLRALLDSGATHSCIGKRALESIARVVGVERVKQWPKAPTPMTVSMANGMQVRPNGAVVLRLGLLTLRRTVVWSDMAFLIFEGMSEDVILGMDWEERMGVTRFQPARMLGLSVTEQSRAAYLNWGAETLSRSAMVSDIPAEVFNHLVPFAMGGEVAGSQRTLLPQAVECTETLPESTAVLRPLQSDGERKMPDGNRRKLRGKSKATGPMSSRAALRSVRHFSIPPKAEIGPIDVRVRCSATEQPL